MSLHPFHQSLKHKRYIAHLLHYKRNPLFFSTVKSKNNSVLSSFEWQILLGIWFFYAFLLFFKILMWFSNLVCMTESLWPSNSPSFLQVENLPTGIFPQNSTYRMMEQQSSCWRKRAKGSKKWPRKLPEYSSNEDE